MSSHGATTSPESTGSQPRRSTVQRMANEAVQQGPMTLSFRKWRVDPRYSTTWWLIGARHSTRCSTLASSTGAPRGTTDCRWDRSLASRCSPLSRESRQRWSASAACGDLRSTTGGDWGLSARLAAEAPNVRCPLLYHVQWDDQRF